MAKKKTCCECGKPLTKDEVALTRKLTDVDTDEFYCLTCFAEYLGCETEDLKVILSILVDTFISKISLPMQPVPEIGSISVA